MVRQKKNPPKDKKSPAVSVKSPALEDSEDVTKISSNLESHEKSFTDLKRMRFPLIRDGENSQNFPEVMSPPSKVMIVSPMIERKPVPYLATPHRSIEIKPQFLLPRNDDFDAQLSGETEEFLGNSRDFSHQSTNSSNKLVTWKCNIVSVNTITASKADEMSGIPMSVLTSSSNGQWDPVGFGMNNFYDFVNGVPLPRDNILKLVKNPKPFDYYTFLDIASNFHGKDENLERLAVGMAVITANANKREPKKSETIVKGFGFNMVLAAKFNGTIVLPSKKTFEMAQVALHDPFFGAFAAAGTSTQGYHPMGKDFYRKIIRSRSISPLLIHLMPVSSVSNKRLLN
ncbi:Protein CBG26267 [Caenorhabditis briggsae]|uniref:Protein CBG26267 n=1 Tax=Caenorhabditis briggsae TaxID=6238 RepID=B6IIB0_CAEBR|nr:Protein CBG26267 [Caenorhabditis briggsae]CAR99640.1 Protein CBG26267 [Caenorhabditis briggsae]